MIEPQKHQVSRRRNWEEAARRIEGMHPANTIVVVWGGLRIAQVCHLAF
jgi:hypothetical protein